MAGQDGDDDKNFKKYPENEKGDLVAVLGLGWYRPQFQHLLAFPVVLDFTECRYPGMRLQLRRYLTFSQIPLEALPREVWPTQMAAQGFFYHRLLGRILCFWCGTDFNNHVRDCQRGLENVPARQGIGPPPVPPSFYQSQLTCTGHVQFRGHVDVSERAGDMCLDALLQRRRLPFEDDHDVHPVVPPGRAIEESQPPQAPAVSDPPLRRASTVPVGEDRRPGTLCKVCDEQPVTVKFEPCDHEVCCAVCALWTRACPLCQQTVDSWREINERR